MSNRTLSRSPSGERWYQYGRQTSPEPNTNADQESITTTKSVRSPRKCGGDYKWYLRTAGGPPVAMIALFIIGSLFALGHHLSYLNLDGNAAGEASSQAPIRGGTILALFAKCCFGGSIAIAQTQWAWMAASQGAVSLTGLDAMLGVTENPAMFFNLELLLKAPLAAVLAFFAWLMPLTTVFSTASLTTIIDQGSIQTGTPLLRYQYNSTSLYISYGLTILITIWAVCMGALAHVNNGNLPSDHFSTIVQTTRDADLNRVDWETIKDDDLGDIYMKLDTNERDEISGMKLRPTFMLSDAAFSATFPLRTTVRYG